MGRMIVVDEKEAAEKFEELLDAVERGEDVVIARDGVSVVRLVRIDPPT